MAAIIDDVKPQPAGYATVEDGEIVDIVFGHKAPAGMLPIFKVYPSYNPAFERILPKPTITIGSDKITFTYEKETLRDALEHLKRDKKHRARSVALEKITTLYGINNGLLTLIVVAKLIEELSVEIDLSPRLKMFAARMKKYTTHVDKIEAFTDEDELYEYDPEEDD